MGRPEGEQERDHITDKHLGESGLAVFPSCGGSLTEPPDRLAVVGNDEQGPAQHPKRPDPVDWIQIGPSVQPLVDAGSLGRPAADHQHVTQGEQERREGLLPSKPDRGAEVFRRGVQRPDSQRGPAGALCHEDRSRIAHQIGTDRMLDGLGLQPVLTQRCEGPGVQPSPDGGGHVVVEALAHQGMDELGGRGGPGLHQPAGTQCLERLLSLPLVEVGHFRPKAGPEPGTQHAGCPRHAQRRRRQAREAGQHDPIRSYRPTGLDRAPSPPVPVHG